MKTNKQKGVVTTAVLVFLAILMIVGGAYWFGSHKSARITSASLQTYTNDYYGLSFEYPEGYAVDINNGEGTMPHIASIRIYCVDKSKACGDISMSLFIENSIDNIVDYVQKVDQVSKTAYEGQPSINVNSSKNISVAGTEAIQRDETMNAAGFDTTVTYYKLGDNIYRFRIDPSSSGLSNSDIEKDVYNTILGTFKLISRSKPICPAWGCDGPPKFTN